QSAELYDPSTGLWTATGDMYTTRQSHTATRLDDGTVLIAGGQYWDNNTQTTVYVSSAEIYHPNTGAFELLPVSMSSVRSHHTATRLSHARALLAGGSPPSTNAPTAEIYDPVSRTFAAAINLVAARQQHTATLLDDHRVLLVGGYQNCCAYVGAEIFDPIPSTLP